jgi:hypothetical protein
MTPKSFSVRIFLQDGHADGVQIIAKSKWSGRGLVIPRASIAVEIKRTELNAPGVFILVGQSTERDRQSIHIGEADPVCHKLEQYDAQKDFWNRAVVFTCKDSSLNRAQIQYLVALLVRRVKEVKRSHPGNLTTPEDSKLSATERVDAETFFAHMLSILPLLGLHAFEGSDAENAVEPIDPGCDQPSNSS